MVLDDSSARNGFGDDAPPSDGDTYDSSIPISYRVANLPTSPFVRDERLQRYVMFGLKGATGNAGRPLTAEEADFTAYWGAKLLVIQSYGRPIGLAGGLWRAWETRSTYKFPFLSQTKNSTWSPEVFPSSSWAYFKGFQARTLWQVLRSSLYGSIGMTIGHILFTGYALSVCSVGARADPRGQSYFKAAEEQQKKRMGISVDTRKEEREPQPYNKNLENESGMESSTTGDVFQEPAPTVGFNSSSGEGITKPAGSAWDRVRQQASSGKSTSSSRWRKPEPRDEIDEAFSGSKVEEDIRDSREKAQKEFDERVEKERHGGSFNEGKGDTDRW